MWLLRTNDLTLVDRTDYVAYAILSHRWEDDEVTFQQMRVGDASHRRGYNKIQRCCREAAKDGIKYAWIDTCCIDKSSSAELSEAINSMYRWYAEAIVCYAYLSDVTRITDLAASVWFTRGWTLQELIAPERVKFFDRDWKHFGSKHGMQAQLSSITGIPTRILRGGDPRSCSIAQRMSWASQRVTKRLEDEAYSLMGLFNVNMPMLYGEGVKAFSRLQEEIIKSSYDHSIFAWRFPPKTQNSGPQGLLAPSTKCFQGCGEVQQTTSSIAPDQYSMTNVGLSIKLKVMPYAINEYIAIIECRDVGPDKELMPHARQKAEDKRLGVFIRRSKNAWQYYRTRCHRLENVTIDPHLLGSKIKILDLLVQAPLDRVEPQEQMYGFIFRNMSSSLFPRDADGLKYQFSGQGSVEEVLWADRFDEVTKERFWSGLSDGLGAMLKQPVVVATLNEGDSGTAVTFRTDMHDPDKVQQHGHIGAVTFGFDFDFNPICVLSKWGIDSKRESSRRDDSLGSSSSYGELMKEPWQRLEHFDGYSEMDAKQAWEDYGVLILRGTRESGLFADLSAIGYRLNVHGQLERPKVDFIKKKVIDVTSNFNCSISIHPGWKDRDTRAWIVDVQANHLPFTHFNYRERETEERSPYVSRG